MLKLFALIAVVNATDESAVLDYNLTTTDCEQQITILQENLGWKYLGVDFYCNEQLDIIE